MDITVSPIIKKKCPNLILGCIIANVVIEKYNKDLWEVINNSLSKIKSIDIEEIKEINAIKSSRNAYKILGKEPSRYRLSAEALHRRVIRGLGLYQISNVVDIINLVSLNSGYSIGGYDLNKIQGNIFLDTGKADESFDAIGRGLLNIENLPVLKDNSGPFGSPTSDSARTMITNSTSKILLVFFNFGNHSDMNKVMEETEKYLVEYANASDVLVYTI
ncbi:B3/4 domain-containing protein [Bacteroidota bacterium]